MKVSFVNIGCKVNFADASQIKEELVNRGAEIVEFGEECDLVLINTCSVTKKAEADSRKYIRRALRSSPNAYIGVMGCYAQLKPDEISLIDGIDGIFGTENKFDIPSLIDHIDKNEKPEIFVTASDDAEFHGSCSIDDESRTRVVLKIQDGCDYYCSYCIVPQARGGSRSMETSQLRTILERLKDSDSHEIILSGINLGTYKSSTGETLSDVLDLIHNLGVSHRIRLSSIEPNLLNDEIIEKVAVSRTFCHHFHIPLQSGSREVLRLMQRRYQPQFFENLIIKIKEKIPDCCIGVDVITGFPGETDEYFMETYNLLESLPISYLHVFTYSERENTHAVKLSGRVRDDVRKERTHQLKLLSAQKKHQFQLSQLGKEMNVITEYYDPGTGLCSGWTDNYIKAAFPGSADLEGLPVSVRLIKISGEFVIGEMIEGYKKNQ